MSKKEKKKTRMKRAKQKRLKKLTKMEYEWEKEYSRRSGWKESWKEGWKEGWIKGLKEGRDLCVLSLIKKKYCKGKPLVQIADELEEDVEVIRPLYDLVEKYPDKTAEELSELYVKQC